MLDSLIINEQFEQWTEHLLKKVAEEKNDAMLWEFFLHKVHDKSFMEWKENLSNDSNVGASIDEAKKEDIIAQSNAILKDFNPDG